VESKNRNDSVAMLAARFASEPSTFAFRFLGFGGSCGLADSLSDDSDSRIDAIGSLVHAADPSIRTIGSVVGTGAGMALAFYSHVSQEEDDFGSVSRVRNILAGFVCFGIMKGGKRRM
jgi:hypothetical protein